VIKRLFRWALYLFIVLVVLFVAGILLLDTIAREIAQSRIRSETGMEVKIGKLSIGLLSPTITIENFKMYNTADFGGSQCIDVPELHVEYDLQAARSGKLHMRLVRFNMAEVDVLRDKKGHTNFDQLQKKRSLAGTPGKPGASSSPAFQFAGIDTLNLTLGTAHIGSLDLPHNNRVINLGIKDQVFHNIKSQNDLMGVAALVSMRISAVNSGSGNPLGGALTPMLH
jgi:uncharacterized protein involved in outer membrane biogenesis